METLKLSIGENMMRKPTLYVVMGWSSAGKDTVAELIQSEYNASIVKFAAPGKRALEQMFRVEPGLLDDRDKRMQVAPFCQGRTYLQVLMDFYHHRKLVIGEDLFTSQTVSELEAMSDSGTNAIITDTRSTNEGEAIIELVQKYCFELVVIWVVRDSAKMLSTDCLQPSIYKSLLDYADEFYTIYNNGSKADLYKTILDSGII